MILSHKIRIYPTRSQANKLNQLFGVARFVFNWGLTRWKDLYEKGEKPNVYRLKKEFTSIRKEQFNWSLEVSKCAYEDGLFRLEKSYKNFFKHQCRYPNYKRKHGKQSCEIPNDKFYIKENKVRLPKIGFVKLSENLRYGGKILKGVLSRKSDRYYISIIVELESCNKLRNSESENQAIGIDVGIKDFLILSNGERFENKKFFRMNENRIRRLNKSMSRKKLRSNNWKKSKLRLQREYLKLTDKRQDYIHKITNFLCKNYKLIVIEDLNVKGMIKNKRLSKAVSELGLSEFRRQLEYKLGIYSNNLVMVNRFFPSSKTCSKCGCINHGLILKDREWDCVCGERHDRDLNAATNILLEGIRIKELKESTVGYTGTCS